MKWHLINTGDEVNVYPDGDILPHQLDSDCPCRVMIAYIEKGDTLNIEDSEEIFKASKATALILHKSNIEKLKESTN